MPNANDISTLHIIGSKGLGGAERFYARLVNALFEENDPVTACLPVNSEIRGELLAGVPVVSAFMFNVHDPLSRFSVRRAIKKTAPDIVQTYMGRATRLVNIDRQKGPVHVARLGGYYNLKGYRHAHACVGNTKGICDYLVKGGFPADRVFHISNFIEVPAAFSMQEKNVFREQHQIPSSAFLLAAVGRLHPNKGFSDLLQAFSQLPDEVQGQAPWLAIAGDGPLKQQLLKQAADLGISDRLVWLGWMLSPDILYQAADVFICPSVHEPLGNVILEAWAQQVPVISTRSDGALELIDDGDNGVLVDVGDSAGMAQAIIGMAREKQSTRDTLVQNGLQKLEQSHGRKVIVDQYHELYRLLLNA